MKPRKRYYIVRFWILVGTLVMGTAAGFLVGRQAILLVLDSRMSSFADELEAREQDLSTELVATLSKANASTFAPCSEADIVLLRKLTFAARFLKDVARIENNSLTCSATVGKLDKAEPLPAPDIPGPPGWILYRSYRLHLPGDNRAEMMVYRNAAVVVSPDNFMEYPQTPFHYITGILQRSTGSIISSHAAPMPFPAELLHGKRRVVKNDVLYMGRYSANYETGILTYIPTKELWSQHRGLLAGFTLTGLAAGLVSGAMLLMAGRKRSSPISQLRRAVISGELSVVYQPIVELHTHRIVGAEALARWTDEEGDSIRPEILVAMAEEDGFVGDVTKFVVTRALEEMLPLMEKNPAFRLSINLAPQDLADPRLLLLLDERLGDQRVTPANIAFELPERATSDREVAVAAIKRLRERGHAIFIDDFGTGFSNLTYLSELNVDGIKINRSFIATIGTDSVTASIVPQILAVAKALNLSVVVQGIERAEQVRYFSQEEPGILGQGWFLGMPVSARSLGYLCAEKTE